MKVITESWTLETHWAAGRPMAKYKGAYPEGFLRRLDERIGLKNKKVLTLFCGSSDYGDTLDIKPELNPTYLADCRKDYSKKLYKEEIVRPYSFTKEAVRICKSGGLICILHQLVYKTLPGTERFAVIPITTGPNQRIRVLNIFKKL